MFVFAPHTRMRQSPYFAATVAAGVTMFLSYNKMLLPASYGAPEEEYWRLIHGVSQWDVAAQRQVQLQGPDAARLAQILTPRDLSTAQAGQGKYVALCDHRGVIINDPILLKLDDDRYWLSIADSDMLYWARAIAAERGLRVAVSEPDVSPLAVQGPKAGEVVAAVLGEWTRDIKHFHFHKTAVAGIPLLLARSGWSRQGGFELYLMDGKKGGALWNIINEAGQPWDIGPGTPNACERIESGLLSWGGDTDDDTNPFEIRLEKFIDLTAPDEVVGIAALRQIHAAGVARHQLGVILEGDTPAASNTVWLDLRQNGKKVGDMTNGIWSPRLQKNIGFALISRTCAVGDRVEVVKENGAIPAQLVALPFVAPPQG